MYISCLYFTGRVSEGFSSKVRQNWGTHTELTGSLAQNSRRLILPDWRARGKERTRGSKRLRCIVREGDKKPGYKALGALMILVHSWYRRWKDYPCWRKKKEIY